MTRLMGTLIISSYRSLNMATTHRKLKRLVSVLVVVEAVFFMCSFRGIGYDIVNSFGTLQNWTTNTDSFELGAPPFVTKNTPSISTDPLLRIYVYDNIPSYLTVDVLEPCVLNSKVRNVAKKRDNFMADVHLIRLFETYPGRTYNPNEADVLVVPYPHKTHCICNLNTTYNGTGNHCPQVPQHDINLLLSRLSYYNQTTKSRHLFIASGDYGWNNHQLESLPLVLTLGPKPERKKGSLVIPYLNSRPEYQPSVLLKSDWNFDHRKYAFAYIYGDAKPRKSRPEFRQAVDETYGTELGGLPFVMEKIKQWTRKRQDDIFSTYRQSILCPCLPGDNAPQKRFFDVIMSGCLPVVLSFNKSRVAGHKSWFRSGKATVRSSYPFAKGLFSDDSIAIDYESFVVQVPENVTNIKGVMESLLLDPQELRRRQESMARYAPFLSYGTGQDAHKYDDAFLRIIKAIKHYLNGLESTDSLTVGGGEAAAILDETSSDTQQSEANNASPGEINNQGETTITSRNSNTTQVIAGFETGIDRDLLPNGPKTHPRPQLTDRLLQRFIVVPEKKLLFCYVEKVGCSMFNHLFRMLRLSLPEVARNVPEASFQANFTWYRNTPKHHGLTKTDLENLLVDSNWTKAVFYRDPVPRFLSAFRSKCEPGHDTTPDCRRVFGKRFVSFDEALARMKRGLPKNPHFAPMSEFCGGLDATLDYYDNVHELNAETVPVHVDSLLRKVGVDPQMTQSLVDDIVRTRGMNKESKNEKLAAQLGVDVGVGKTQSEGHNTEANQQLCQYYNTPEKLSFIKELFRVDYDTFRLAPREINCTP